MVAKKAAAESPAVKAEEKSETKKTAVKKAAAKKAEVKTKVKEAAAEVKEAVEKKVQEKPVKTAVKKAADKVRETTETKTDKAAADKPKETDTAKKAPKKKAAPKITSIFKAIEAGDIVSFKALIATQKNRRGEAGRTPLMVVSLIRSNPRMTDGSNYETKRVTGGKEIYDKMYQLLIEAKCDKNAMDDAGNTARDYNYGGILNQMLAD